MTLRLSWPIHFYPIIQSFDFLPDSICKGQSRFGSGLWCIQQLAAPEFWETITPWCKQKGNRQEMKNKDVNYQITKADYKVEEDGLLICKGVILGCSKTPHRVLHASNGPSITSWSLPRKSPNRTIHCAVSVVAFTGIDMGKLVCLKNSQNLDFKAKRRELTWTDHFLSREFSGAQGFTNQYYGIKTERVFESSNLSQVTKNKNKKTRRCLRNHLLLPSSVAGSEPASDCPFSRHSHFWHW